MSPTAPADIEDDTAAPGPNVLFIVLAALGAVSVVIAGLVILSSGEGSAPAPEPSAPVAARQGSVVVGPEDAPLAVTIFEDFASPESRELDLASRDFLRIVAAQGGVRVEYRPVAMGTDDYSRDALTAWFGVLGAASPRQALAFHDVLLDHQPTAGAQGPRQFLAWAKDRGIDDPGVLDAMAEPHAEMVARAQRAAVAAGVRRPPVVLVDGKPLAAGTAADPTALADRLQRLVLKEG